MPETKTVRLRAEIKDQARVMELRMRSKEPAIKAGDMSHWKQTSLKELLLGMNTKRGELERMALAGATTSETLEEAADLANYARFVALRIGMGDRVVRVET